MLSLSSFYLEFDADTCTQKLASLFSPLSLMIPCDISDCRVLMVSESDTKSATLPTELGKNTKLDGKRGRERKRE